MEQDVVTSRKIKEELENAKSKCKELLNLLEYCWYAQGVFKSPWDWPPCCTVNSGEALPAR